MIVKCDQCGKEINKKPCHVKINAEKGHKNYCSDKCRKTGQFKGQLYNCGYCSKEIYRIPSQVKKSKSGLVFCNSSCACSYNNTALRSGENNPNWKDGETAYTRFAYNTYKKECSICGFNNENALEIHHIDKNRANNELDNLIILCANHHTLIHRGSLVINDEIKNNRKFL
jgi:hypothetical protein